MEPCIGDVLRADHERLDGVFRALLAALESGGDAQAARLARELDEGLQRHIRFEEEVLFPAVPYSPRSIESLTIDHGMIRELLAVLRASLEARDVEGARAVAGNLKIYLEGHNRDEEIGVYRGADRLDASRQVALIAGFQALAPGASR